MFLNGVNVRMIKPTKPTTFLYNLQEGSPFPNGKVIGFTNLTDSSHNTISLTDSLNNDYNSDSNPIWLPQQTIYYDLRNTIIPNYGALFLYGGIFIMITVETLYKLMKHFMLIL